MEEELLEIWGHRIPMSLLSVNDAQYLSRFKLAPPPKVEALWREMDDVWHQLGLDNRKPLTTQRIADYYRHPVWILNGLFSASDGASLAHRQTIADFVSANASRRIADYGGGFGQLAIALAKTNTESTIEIVEPFPSALGQSRIVPWSNVKMVSTLGKNYDALIVQDVLEHVEDPLGLAMELAAAVKPGGHLIFANCFFGFIQCHLPRTFHLRRTFPFVMREAGLKYLRTLPGASHIQVFQRVGTIDPAQVRQRERISSVIGPLFNLIDLRR
jgi:2-polyprenyl-6-hydroxyphenyl methylase/3-demethylubiquinone-9 3-methyltransferase